MSQRPVDLAPRGPSEGRSAIAFTEGTGSDLTRLIAAAIAIGRMPGEPATVLRPGQRPRLLARLLGIKLSRPLADPRLEVIRAISASLTRGIGTIHADLLTAAAKAGWSRDELSVMFPSAGLRAASWAAGLAPEG